jgi:hypothetical protein
MMIISKEQALEGAHRKAASLERRMPLRELKQLVASRSGAQRLFALFVMREQLAVSGLIKGYFRLAEGLVLDRDNNCRWQALIVIGEFLKQDPALVWPVIRIHAVSKDDDMRTAVATVLLEHLLEYHLSRYWHRVRRAALTESPLFADTLSRCAHFGLAQPHSREIRSVVARAKAKLMRN